MADVYADILCVAPRPPLGLKRDLIDALNVTDLVAPEVDHVLGSKLTFVRWFHHDLNVNKVLTSHVGLNPLGCLIQVVLFEHPQGRISDQGSHSSCLVRGGAYGQSHSGLNFVGGYFGHGDDSHVVAIAVASYYRQQRDGTTEGHVAVAQAGI